MSRVVLHGGRIFDGTRAPVAGGDVAIEDGRILEVGPGLDGDEQVDVSGMTLLPGLFDCHVHVTMSGIDLLRRLQRPFSYQFYEAARNLAATLDCGMAPADVLVAATSSAAELLGVAGRTGTLSPGKRADLVAVEGDPFDLASLKSAIRLVYSGGRLVRGQSGRSAPAGYR